MNPHAARERLPYGEGVFRRRYRLRAEPDRVVADMEDDFHRFRVLLSHDGEHVTQVEGEAYRYPWTACPGATTPLRALTGMALSERFSAGAERTNPRVNCTHLFDLASLAVTHAAGKRELRQYDLVVPDRDARGCTHPTLQRDGAQVLSWDVESTEIVAPAPFAGQGLRGSGFLAWAEAHLDAETAEAALLLRRSLFIAMGRVRDLDEAAAASAYMGVARGSCHSFTPGIAEGALRVRGTSLEFSSAPHALLADLGADPLS